MKVLQFTGLRTNNAWISPAFISLNDDGIITNISDQKPDDAVIFPVNGLAIPGFQNAHSHAFQFGMAGMAEQHSENTSDDFWTWREKMYASALKFSPDEMKDVAKKLYGQLAKNGYTSVAEFHYVHHDLDGNSYENLSETGEKLVEAAKEVGLKITLVPVFYQKGNFDTSPHTQQRRFICKNTDEYFKLLTASAESVKFYAKAKLGFGVHSLRAADADAILETYQSGPKGLPFHMHVAEQLKEIKDCENAWHSRPVQWCLDHLPLNSNFHLIHCTHLNDAEVEGLAKSGANVVLCPGTEGNLGDGIFRLKDYARFGGNWSIGTDSHISLNPLEDLRWLDYAQRLITHQRNTFADGAKTLVEKTFFSGKLAMGEKRNDFFEIGKSFDAVVYDLHHPLLEQSSIDHWLSVILYTLDSSAVLGTIVDGDWIYRKND